MSGHDVTPQPREVVTADLREHRKAEPDLYKAFTYLGADK